MRNSKLINKLFIAVITFALASTSILAQRAGAPPQTGPAGQSVVGADIKGRAPVNKDILKVNLPKAQEATLANGLRVVLLENHRVPTFTMQMVVLSGGMSDPADYHGLASFTATLLREGTAARKSKEIAEQTDTLGATINANSGLSSLTSVVTTSGLVETLGTQGKPADRVMVLGFSQGACLTLEFAARNPRRYAAIFGLSGGLIGPAGTPRDYSGLMENTPVFLGCSDVDAHIPVERVRESAEVFRRMGATVDERIYPRMGHTINQDELQAVRALLVP